MDLSSTLWRADKLSQVTEIDTLNNTDVNALRQPVPGQIEIIDLAIERGSEKLCQEQRREGYWCYEFEADCTISAEYILMMHFMDEVDVEIEQKIAVYLRSKQGNTGGWSLYPGGEMDLSCTVKVYYALKLVGDNPEESHMKRAREAILEQGGAVRVNVFTRITLALFGQVPWFAVPFMPAEIMLLPKWFPFHISKVSYWSRTVMVPLFILYTMHARAVNPRGVGIPELFLVDPNEVHDYFPSRSLLNLSFYWLDRIGRRIESFVPEIFRRRSIKKATRWIAERLNGEDGLGGIFPAMVNAHEALKVMGYPPEHPYRKQSKAALKKLLVYKDDHIYCQPCLSPVWDTGLACLTLQQVYKDKNINEVRAGLDWLKPLQLLDEPGDWQWKRPNLRGGGWAFEFNNPHYPDIDDTPVIAMAMLQADAKKYSESIARAAEWVAGMQSQNGGFGSFDVDNNHYYLNEIPFADHGALLDPPTSDVTARCITFLCYYDKEKYHSTIEAGLAFLLAEQEKDGSWFGRWGTNYIYGTWSVLAAFKAAGESLDAPHIRRAVDFLKLKQREDGGWGESNDGYIDPDLAWRVSESTSFQSAWGLMGLMMVGEAHSEAVRKGIDYLLKTQQDDGLWNDAVFTAPGFPRVFYLKYYGYSHYFPLWALAMYRDKSYR